MRPAPLVGTYPGFTGWASSTSRAVSRQPSGTPVHPSQQSGLDRPAQLLRLSKYQHKASCEALPSDSWPMLGVLLILSLFFITFCVPALLVVWLIARLRERP